MAVILGSDGFIQLDLGNGLLCVANAFSWTVNLDRETLDTTRQGDEARRRTGGLADHTGSLSLRLLFAEDTAQALSAWQLLNFAITGADDALKAGMSLYLQRDSPPANCSDELGMLIPGAITLSGTVVVTSINLDCTEPGEPVVAVVNWAADGALQLTRAVNLNAPATGVLPLANVGTGELRVDVSGATPVLMIYDGRQWAPVAAVHGLADVDDTTTTVANQGALLVRDASVAADGSPGAWKTTEALDAGLI